MLPPSQHMPNRPADWRWERARWLRENGKYARRNREDPFVLLAKRFQDKLSRCHTAASRARLAAEFPGIFWAYELYRDTENVVRYQVEARLLAGEPAERVAHRCFLSPDVVRWYERLFFNVSDAMDSLDYLCGVVVGKAIYHGVTDRDYDILWKIYAIASRGRPEVLDALFTTLGNSTADAFFADDARSVLKRKSSIAARTVPVALNQQAILDIHARLREVDDSSGKTGDTSDLFAEHVRAMMTSLGRVFTVAHDAEKGSLLEEYDRQAAELRAREAVEVAAGRESEQHRATSVYQFPTEVTGSGASV